MSGHYDTEAEARDLLMQQHTAHAFAGGDVLPSVPLLLPHRLGEMACTTGQDPPAEPPSLLRALRAFLAAPRCDPNT